MVYITGDTHGDASRFSAPVLRKAGENDIVIVCGDFGFLWNNAKQEQKLRKKLTALPFTIAFVDGCHENYDLLAQYPTQEWNGGTIHVIAPNILHLMRGQIYTICGKTFFTFGGGHSQDFEFRNAGTWWEEEQPSYKEILDAIEALKAHDNTIDYIITHEPPASIKDCLRIDTAQRLELHTFFEDLMHTCTFTGWYFGKCHLNRRIPLKYHAVFDTIHALKATRNHPLHPNGKPKIEPPPPPPPINEPSAHLESRADFAAAVHRSIRDAEAQPKPEQEESEHDLSSRRHTE